MKAVILAGGLGTRISEESHLKPKPMIEIGGKPIIWHIMKIYAAHGVNDFVICLGYKGYVIKEYFANYFLHMSDVTFDMAQNKMEVHQASAEPWRVTLVDTGEATMTGGRLKRVAPYLGDEPFCFTYGDGVSDVDITHLIRFHRSEKRWATLTAVQPPGRFGALNLDGNPGDKLRGKTTRRWRLHQRRLLRTFSEGHRLHRWRFDRLGACSDGTPRPRAADERVPASGVLAADGYAARQDALGRAVGIRQGPLEDLVMSGDFWHGKRVLVTGYSGFKGGWLSIWLRSLGAEVSGFALQPPTEPSLCQVAGVEQEIRAVRGDVRDLSALERSMRDAKPEVVFHLAAQALVRPSYDDPVETYSTNVMGTVNVLEAVRRLGSTRVVVVVTSDKCYENREWVWGYREDEPMGGHDPYSNSKGCAELVTAAYRRSFFHATGTAVASARAGNVIGGGDWAADRLIPDIIRAVSHGEPVLIRSPKAVRPWQHVLEPLAGYLLLAQKLWDDGPRHIGGWNFGPADEDAKPVQQLVEKITALWGEGASWVLDERQHPHEAHYLKLDCSKARQVLGWRPRLRLADALEWTVDWYKGHNTRLDMRTICQAQIEAYQRLESA